MIKNKIILIIPFVSLFVFVIFAFRESYSYFVYNKEVAEINLNSGEISIDFTNGNNSSSIVSNQIIDDEVGKNSLDYLEFTVTGKADTESILYELEIVPNNGNSIDTKYIKYYLTEVDNNNETSLIAPLLHTELYNSIANNGKGIYQNIISGNQDGTSKTTLKRYRLRAWIDKSYEGESNKTFGYSVYLYAINVDNTKYVKVSFNLNDGRGVGLSKYVEKNNEYGSLATPVRDGYTFLGWKINDEDASYIINNTTVSQLANHNLKAIWNQVDAPTLELSKVTYINVPFDDSWSYCSAAHVEDDNMVFSYESNMGNYRCVKSDYIDVNHDIWYISFDFNVEDVAQYHAPKGGIYWEVNWFDDNKTIREDVLGTTYGGFTVANVLNTWKNEAFVGGSAKYAREHPRANSYGPNVKYIRIYFSYVQYNSETGSGGNYASNNGKIRDVKVYGQMENDFYLIDVDATDTEGIKEIKYAKGNQSIDYFENNGINVENNQIKVFENGIYTVYAKGVRGNSTIDTIEITNIV